MKVAVFDHQLNFGGGLRFLTNLLIAIRKNDASTEITLFCNQNKLKEKIEIYQELENSGITIQHLNVFNNHTIQPISLSSRAVRFIKRNLFNKHQIPFNFETALEQEIIKCSAAYDIAYFPWPYFLKSPKTICPKVATFHDFNFKYFFGVQIFDARQTTNLNQSLKVWMKDTIPVVSTHFMEKELMTFYPEVKQVNVVHLGSLNMYHHQEYNSLVQFPFKYLLDKPYIICPVHLTVHKNIGNIIAATSIVNSDVIKFNLVFTGNSTEFIRGRSSYFGLKTEQVENPDVYGLGYISDSEMNQLLRNAFAVLNASLYEAGNGVGLDAWPLGIPVIQSNIPAFEEHINLQKFEAFSFDPRNAHSIAKAIETCLSDNNQREKKINQSLTASVQLDWKIVANKYLEIFKGAIKNNNNGN